MRKIIAIGSLLLTSAAVLVTPALAAGRNDYYARPNMTYQARIEQQRRDVRAVRDSRAHDRRDWRDYHYDYDRDGD
jgi:hypothetical protein